MFNVSGFFLFSGFFSLSGYPFGFFRHTALKVCIFIGSILWFLNFDLTPSVIFYLFNYFCELVQWLNGFQCVWFELCKFEVAENFLLHFLLINLLVWFDCFKLLLYSYCILWIFVGASWIMDNSVVLLHFCVELTGNF